MAAFELPLDKSQYTRLNHLNDNFTVAIEEGKEPEIDKAAAATREYASTVCALHGREFLPSYTYSFGRLRGGKGTLYVADKQS